MQTSAVNGNLSRYCSFRTRKESSCVFASDTLLSIFLYRVNQRTIRLASKSPDVNFYVADFDNA